MIIFCEHTLRYLPRLMNQNEEYLTLKVDCEKYEISESLKNLCTNQPERSKRENL